MKITTVLTLSLLAAIPGLNAQNIDLKDLKTPNSPGFQILDLSPSSIERPTNPKAFALSIFNYSNNGTAIPKNFSFEISPYWYVKPGRATVQKYLNIRDQQGSNIFTGIYNKLSLSLASSYSDSSNGSLLKNTNYLSVGVRTNLLTVRTRKQSINLQNKLNAISNRLLVLRDSIQPEKRILKSRLVRLLNQLDDETDSVKQKKIAKEVTDLKNTMDRLDQLAPGELEKKATQDTELQDNIKGLNEVPVFQLTAAYAYSEAIPGNTWQNRRFNRSGYWLDASLSGFGFNQADLQDNLSLTASIKFITDNALIDTASNLFERTGALDVGGKLEYFLRDISLSVEHLRRTYSAKADLNSNRTVAVIQYKVNDNLYLQGSYGKNFGSINNLFALLGINWGFGKTSLFAKKE